MIMSQKKEPPKKKIKAEEQKPEKINRGRKSKLFMVSVWIFVFVLFSYK